MVLPIRNKVDIENIPEDVKKGLDVYLVDRLEEIVDMVLVNNPSQGEKQKTPMGRSNVAICNLATYSCSSPKKPDNS